MVPNALHGLCLAETLNKISLLIDINIKVMELMHNSEVQLLIKANLKIFTEGFQFWNRLCDRKIQKEEQKEEFT